MSSLDFDYVFRESFTDFHTLLIFHLERLKCLLIHQVGELYIVDHVWKDVFEGFKLRIIKFG